MVFYNTRRMAQSAARNCSSSDLSQLTKVVLTDVKVRRVSSLRDLRLRIGASVNDPVYLLAQAERDAAEMRAGWGVKVELAFSMRTARVVGAVQAARDTHALGQILVDSNELGRAPG
jgi:hypothetical protein